MVGMRGFEPPTSRSRTERANRTALHPDRFGSNFAEPGFCQGFIVSRRWPSAGVPPPPR